MNQPNKRRFIVEIQDETISDETAFSMLLRVVRQGRVSNDGKQYCYGTRFLAPRCVIYAIRRNDIASERFVIQPIE